MEKIYDSVIIGGGPSALTAGLYLGRYERETLILAADLGGQTAIAGMLENFPGSMEISGLDLIENLKKQVENLEKITLKYPAVAETIEKISEGFTVKMKTGESVKAKSIIISAGKRHRKLGIKGEDELIGKGLSYCATCDGPFARGKKIIIAGGGYAATEAALILVKIAEDITLINLTEKLTGEKITLDKIDSEKKIKSINGGEIKEFVLEGGLIAGLKYIDKQTGEEKVEAGKMVFVEIGQVPNSENFKQIVSLNDYGEIIIDQNNMTSVEGVFAAGDITTVPAKQTIVACGEGAKAAIAVNKYLENNYSSK